VSEIGSKKKEMTLLKNL